MRTSRLEHDALEPVKELMTYCNVYESETDGGNMALKNELRMTPFVCRNTSHDLTGFSVHSVKG